MSVQAPGGEVPLGREAIAGDRVGDEDVLPKDVSRAEERYAADDVKSRVAIRSGGPGEKGLVGGFGDGRRGNAGGVEELGDCTDRAIGIEVS